MFDATSWVFHTWGGGMFYTHDSGKTWAKVGDGSNFQLRQAKDGNFYVGSAFGFFSTKDGSAWTKVAGIQVDALVVTGSRFYAAFGDDAPKFMTASQGDPSTWTTWPTPPKLTHRVSGFAYDDSHQVLYSANTSDGLWRVKMSD